MPGLKSSFDPQVESAGAALIHIRLQEQADGDAWRAASRALLMRNIRPDRVTWSVEGAAEERQGDMFASARDDWREQACRTASIQVPKKFVALANDVVCHADPQRFALLYRLLWRLDAGERGLLSVASDPDVRLADTFSKAVRRDSHKMKAFVRFKAVSDSADPPFVAWFEPSHFTLERTAPFFARRFTGMHWSILTPYRSVRWDGRELTFGAGATKADAPADDALEDAWRAYYRAIFNPARLKTKAMQAEMPKKYWRNLPEASEIAGLMHKAGDRTQTMIAAEAPAPSTRGRVLSSASQPRWGEAAPGAGSWSEFRQACLACRNCQLCDSATQAVLGEGATDARLMIVGEQPGDLEDRTGRPFVGPAGQILDQAIAATGLDRPAMYLTNAVKHFGFQQRGKRRMHKTPKTAEVNACLPWLIREIDLVRPRVILALGRTAGRAVFGRNLPVAASRGKPMETGMGPQGLLTFHPAAILRSPADVANDQTKGLIQDLALAAKMAFSK